MTTTLKTLLILSFSFGANSFSFGQPMSAGGEIPQTPVRNISSAAKSLSLDQRLEALFYLYRAARVSMHFNLENIRLISGCLSDEATYSKKIRSLTRLNFFNEPIHPAKDLDCSQFLKDWKKELKRQYREMVTELALSDSGKRTDRHVYAEKILEPKDVEKLFYNLEPRHHSLWASGFPSGDISISAASYSLIKERYEKSAYSLCGSYLLRDKKDKEQALFTNFFQLTYATPELEIAEFIKDHKIWALQRKGIDLPVSLDTIGDKLMTLKNVCARVFAPVGFMKSINEFISSSDKWRPHKKDILSFYDRFETSYDRWVWLQRDKWRQSKYHQYVSTITRNPILYLISNESPSDKELIGALETLESNAKSRKRGIDALMSAKEIVEKLQSFSSGEMTVAQKQDLLKTLAPAREYSYARPLALAMWKARNKQSKIKGFELFDKKYKIPTHFITEYARQDDSQLFDQAMGVLIREYVDENQFWTNLKHSGILLANVACLLPWGRAKSIAKYLLSKSACWTMVTVGPNTWLMVDALSAYLTSLEKLLSSDDGTLLGADYQDLINSEQFIYTSQALLFFGASVAGAKEIGTAAKNTARRSVYFLRKELHRTRNKTLAPEIQIVY